MKVNPVKQGCINSNIKTNCEPRSKKAPAMNAPSFGGKLAVNFWDAVARGGFAASFTVQDMTGTNFPRTYQALQRNKEITGENNYKAAAEVAIREFMTGPSMCIIPMCVLAVAKKLDGATNEVPMENIAPFADEMKSVLKNSNPHANKAGVYSQEVKKSFYERMFALSLGEDLKGGKEVSNSAKELASMLDNYDNAPKRNLFQQLLNKDIMKKSEDGLNKVKVPSKDQIFDDIITKFTDTRKTLTKDYSDLLSTDLGGTLKKENSISDLVKDFSNFGNSVKKTIQKHVAPDGTSNIHLKLSSFMDDFKYKKTGSKFITNILMVVATALFMMNIPKLYTLYETNPETDAFRKSESEVKDANK